MQTLVQNHIGTKLCTDDYMALYEPKIDEFFSKFNTSIVKEFKFDQINMYLQEGLQQEKEEEFYEATLKSNGD